MAGRGHGGNLKRLAEKAGVRPGDLLDFSASLNPLGPPDWYRPLVSSRLGETAHYPDPDCTSLVEALCDRYGVDAGEVLPGNGSTELLYLLPRAVPAKRAVIPVPAYADYARAAELAGLAVKKIFLKEDEGFSLDLAVLQAVLRDGDLVFIGRPNNPTGVLCDAEDLRGTAARNPGAIFLVDEAFADFVQDLDSLTQRRPANLLVLCSLTKFFAIPGLRLGAVIGDSGIVGRMRELMPPWSVNTLAQAVGEAALKDADYARLTREQVAVLREDLSRELRTIGGLTVYPGCANFLLLRLEGGKTGAPGLAEKMLRKGIALRVCDNFDGLDARFLRVAVRGAEENARLVDALREILGAAPRPGRRVKKPALMIQGTGSNAGKSIIAAALCRILLQDGYSVAPFKAQNMSLNSFVTAGGGEMGRAQVVQAQACRLAPDVRMNPVLLKPNSDTGSQVIVLGKPVGNMDVETYIRYKPRVFETVKEAYDSLADQHDVMVLEGAGSPAEVNLKHHDIVNMQMARHARSPVLLAGDIDRGGVFASFVGTLEVLSEWERALVAGFIINRFRGDESLLASAVRYTERHTGRPTFGIIPYLRDLGLPEEDSVTFKAALPDARPAGAECVEIALIDLPHISNFTDFDSFRLEPDVHLRVVRSSRDLENPAALILPGSKNVIGDLEYLKKNGLARKILDLARGGRTELVGICGGFQILGGEVADPHGIESGTGKTAGLGLLPVATTLAREKTLTSAKARHVESGCALKGYEIHHGLTGSSAAAPSSGPSVIPAVIREDGEVLGVRSADGLLWGTYLHGIFDADQFRRWFIDRLRVRQGLSPVGRVLAAYDLELAFDRLADAVRGSLRIKDIYRLMGLP